MSLADAGKLIKGVSGMIQNEEKGGKSEFVSMSLGTLGTSLFGNILTRKGDFSTGEGPIRGDEGSIRADLDI